ncbi:transglutaminase domain-containing protein, partial [Catenibacillus scindens]|uniref:transglutaminase domain-containing protein n=1 Tax=Catenibacillus scindens TaxID=673271 RepID=UPI00320A5FC9
MKGFKYLIGGLGAVLILFFAMPGAYASDFEDGVEAVTADPGDEMGEEALSLNINHLGGYESAYMFANEISTFALDVESVLRQELASALEQFVFQVDVSDLGLKRDSATVQMLTDIASDILNSDYRYFYISGFSYLYDQNDNIASVRWTCDSSYLISGTQEPDVDRIKGELSELEAALDKALDCVDSRMTVVEKVLAVHDYIVRVCDYDQENYVNNTVSVHSYSAWGVLIDGKAVCQGYAETFGAMMKALGIDSCLVASPSMNHIWNMVYIDGVWYHVDATWDDPVLYGTTAMGLPNNDYADEGYCVHKSFLKSDSEMTALGYFSWDDDVPDAPVSQAFNSYCFYNAASDMSYYNTYWYYLQSPGTICRAKIDGSDKQTFSAGDGAYLHLLGNVLYYSDSKGVYSFDPARGSSAVYFSVDKTYPGYTLTEFAVKNDQMIGVLWDG